jgi:glycerol-3-phosphate acyltransferase PlsY
MPSILPFLFPLLGYLSGSLPFSIWITRWLKGVDVRDAGSGHATTTNTIRQAGFAAGAVVLVLDVAKGFIPVWLALRSASGDIYDIIIPLTAALAVAGHCWPVFAGFRGGMGLATTGGCLLAVSPLAAMLSLGILVLLVLVIHHGARASVITGVLMAPLLYLFGLRGHPFWMAIAMGAVIAFRFLIDWNRQYRELWLDRQPPPSAGDSGTNEGGPPA